MSHDRPFLNREDAAKILGPNIKGKTISTYLYESHAQLGRGDRKRPGRYAHHPFPAPDGYHGKAPWWNTDRAPEIREWAAARPGQGAGGGRPHPPTADTP